MRVKMRALKTETRSGARLVPNYQVVVFRQVRA
uniref:Uncharacterized protein n=1 Tax=Anguilla anguilla TaxID=7936 RepID=A0A0E9V511_ANGAN